MPESRAQHKPGEVCPRCQVPHLTPSGTPACVGHSKTGSGKACRRAPVDGQTVCVTHGAHAPQNVAAAEKRIAEREAVKELTKLGLMLETDPITALEGQVWESAGNVAFLRAKVQELENIATSTAFGPVLDIHVKLYNEERDRHVGVVATAIKLGLDERRVRAIERELNFVIDLLRKVLDDPELGLSPEQRERGRQIGARHLELAS